MMFWAALSVGVLAAGFATGSAALMVAGFYGCLLCLWAREVAR